MKTKILTLILIFSLLPSSSAFAGEPLVSCNGLNITPLSNNEFRLSTSHAIDPNEELDEGEFSARTIYNVSTTSLIGLTEPDFRAATHYSEPSTGRTLDDTVVIEIAAPGRYYIKAFISFSSGSVVEFFTSNSCQKSLIVHEETVPEEPSCELSLPELINLLGRQAALEFYENCYPATSVPQTGFLTQTPDYLQLLNIFYLPAAITAFFLLRYIIKRKHISFRKNP
jgi:hypothetical protein